MVYGIGSRTRDPAAPRGSGFNPHIPALILHLCPNIQRDVPVFSGKGHTLDNSGRAQARRTWRSVLEAIQLLSPWTWFQIVLWFPLLKLALVYHVGVLFFIATGFYIIFTNLGERKSTEEYSAYSVFNKGMKRLPGQYTTEAFERELTGRHSGED